MCACVCVCVGLTRYMYRLNSTCPSSKLGERLFLPLLLELAFKLPALLDSSDLSGDAPMDLSGAVAVGAAMDVSGVNVGGSAVNVGGVNIGGSDVNVGGSGVNVTGPRAVSKDEFVSELQDETVSYDAGLGALSGTIPQV